MQTKKHLFFDLDHTLWDFEANSNKTFIHLFKKHQLNISVEKFLYYYKHINLSYWALYRNEKISKERLKYKRLEDTFEKIKTPVSEKTIAILADEYLEYLPDNNLLFEGAIEILEYLHPKYNLHIITNGFNDIQSKKIKNAQLTHYFQEIITSENSGAKKPNPLIFNFALHKAGALKNDSVMIGDNWEADIMGALNIGIDAIYFNPEQKPVSEHIASVSKLIELKRYL